MEKKFRSYGKLDQKRNRSFAVLTKYTRNNYVKSPQRRVREYFREEFHTIVKWSYKMTL